jgi:uncharacterized protein with PQ loop repeat
MAITEIVGFAGAGLAGAAYVPQISHLIRARCSAGISQLAFAVWLLASVLITARAIAIHAGVFIALGGIQIVATTFIMFYAARFQDTPCPSHHPVRPGPRQAPLAGRQMSDVQVLRSEPMPRLDAAGPGANVARPGKSRQSPNLKQRT